MRKISKYEDDPKVDTLVLKQRGRPPRSKNKTSSKKEGDFSNKSLPSANDVGVVFPPPSIIS